MGVKTLKPRVRTISSGAAGISATKRIDGNTRVAVVRRLDRERPRLCAECERNGYVRYGAELDHIAPLWKGGSNDPTNLQWLCRECHATKTAREAAERGGGGSKV